MSTRPSGIFFASISLRGASSIADSFVAQSHIEQLDDHRNVAARFRVHIAPVTHDFEEPLPLLGIHDAARRSPSYVRHVRVVRHTPAEPTGARSIRTAPTHPHRKKIGQSNRLIQQPLVCSVHMTLRDNGGRISWQQQSQTADRRNRNDCWGSRIVTLQYSVHQVKHDALQWFPKSTSKSLRGSLLMLVNQTICLLKDAGLCDTTVSTR